METAFIFSILSKLSADLLSIRMETRLVILQSNESLLESPLQSQICLFDELQDRKDIYI